jgi:hypothetical protein
MIERSCSARAAHLPSAPRMRGIRLWLVVTPVLVVSAYGCNWSALWGLDAPRPALASDDTFAVDPLCPDLIIDRSGLALAPRIVTITGHRNGSRLGAESVPVTVRRGPCDQSADAGGPLADGGSSTKSNPNASKDAGSRATSAAANAASCYAGGQPLDNAYANAIELVEHQDGGCRQRSPSLLECTLNARGEAVFEVQGRVPDNQLSLGGYVPICVSPLEVNSVGNEQRSHAQELRIVPRLGTSMLALAVLQLPDAKGPSEPQADAGAATGCDMLFDCAQRRARATFQAGVVSADIPVADLRTGDFLPVRRDVELKLHLRTLNALAGDAANAFLSKSASCPTTDASLTGDNALPLSIRNGASDTDAFFLCASRYSSSYQVTAELTAMGTMDADASAAPQAGRDAPAVRPNMVMLPALPQGYATEPSAAGAVVDTKLCGGEQVHAPLGSVRISGATRVANDDRIVLACAAKESDQDGGAVTSTQGVQSADASDCGHVMLAPITGGTCRLDVSKSN